MSIIDSNTSKDPDALMEGSYKLKAEVDDMLMLFRDRAGVLAFQAKWNKTQRNKIWKKNKRKKLKEERSRETLLFALLSEWQAKKNDENTSREKKQAEAIEERKNEERRRTEKRKQEEGLVGTLQRLEQLRRLRMKGQSSTVVEASPLASIFSKYPLQKSASEPDSDPACNSFSSLPPDPSLPNEYSSVGGEGKKANLPSKLFYYKAYESIQNLIDVRSQWDVYVVPQSTVGSGIPSFFIAPPDPPEGSPWRNWIIHRNNQEEKEGDP